MSGQPPMFVRFSSAAAIICLGILVYSNTFHSSFHFDDQVFIVNNFYIKHLQDLLQYWKFYPTRFITFFSIFLNYHFNKLDVFGYHVFNLAVHLGSAILVWWFTLMTLSTPSIKEDKITRHAGLIALLAGLVFVSHPVQVESVTYIWQRTASMAAFFYLASLCLYIRSRLIEIQGPVSVKVNLYYFFSLLTAVMAMFTKENSITLPLMVLLYEFYFFGTRVLNWRACAFLLTIFIIPFTLLLTKSPQLHAIQKFVQEPGGTSPLDYFLTQFRVLVTYIRLVFLPIGQNLDYDYSISKSFFEGPVMLSFLFLAGILYAAKRLFSNYRLLSFSVFWFFLSLSLESGLLPLRNVMFEHRLYLPLVGYSLFLVCGMYYLLGRNNIKALVIAMAVLIGFNSLLTYQRNKVWRDERTLWSDALKKSPHKARVYNNLGFANYSQGHFAQAIVDYDKALGLNSKLADAYDGRGLAFSRQGDFVKAIADYNEAIAIDPGNAEAYNNRGIFYFHQGHWAQAILDLDHSIEIDPHYARAFYNRGLVMAQGGHMAQAVADYNKATRLDPDYADAYYNRGLIFAREKYYDEAVFDLDKAIGLKSDDADAYNNRGIVYALQGKFDQAISDFNQAVKINPHDMQAVHNLANALNEKTGR